MKLFQSLFSWILTYSMIIVPEFLFFFQSLFSWILTFSSICLTTSTSTLSILVFLDFNMLEEEAEELKVKLSILVFLDFNRAIGGSQGEENVLSILVFLDFNGHGLGGGRGRGSFQSLFSWILTIRIVQFQCFFVLNLSILVFLDFNHEFWRY